VSWQLVADDCASALAGFDAATVDALVTDPPAGIGFMGKAWDADKGGREAWVAWLAGVMRECLRLMKPGAHGLVWALPRTSHWTATALEDAGLEVRDVITHHFGTGFPKSKALLKPASEHWILVRKPGPLQHLNIDACRIEGAPRDPGFRDPSERGDGWGMQRTGLVGRATPTGRWPANLVLSHTDCDEGCADDCPVRELDGQSGATGRTGALVSRNSNATKSVAFGRLGPADTTGHGDSGGASRFFYVAKPCKSERGAGNTHPTVKSIALMSWLIRLITPPGGLVLDPFAGSGTTGVAAVRGGWEFLGIERDEQYVKIAESRLRQLEAA